MSQRIVDTVSSNAQETIGAATALVLDYSVGNYNNCSVRVVSEIQGRDTSNGDTFSVTIVASFSRGTGAATLITQGATSELRSTGFILLGPSATALASGNNARIQVTGMNGRAIEWWGHSKIYVH